MTTLGSVERLRAGSGPAYWPPHVAVAAMLIIELLAILALNDGMLVYSLDDAYIHLALAENIARGHYGINLTEPSAPSSSILWPFLLVPYSGTDFHDKWPLILNIAAVMASVGMLQAIVRRALPPGSCPSWLPPLLVIAAATALNLVGLVFTGMEHSLQVLLALAVVRGLVIEAEERRITWYLILSVLVGPLVRYENLALSLGAVCYLGLRGRLWAACGLGIATILPLVAFSQFLLDLGLGWLPSSVLLKTSLASGDGGVTAVAVVLVRSLLWSPIRISHLLLLAILGLLLWCVCRPEQSKVMRLLAVAGSTWVVAHLAVGKYGWFGRYEVYAMISAAALLLYLYRHQVSFRLLRRAPRTAGAALISVPLVLGLPILRVPVLTPLAANNIYEQQYQMHRFVTDYAGGATVAVNDLGWVSYRNDGYVLDLWGLGSIEAGARRTENEPGWMEVLVRRHDARLAMVYDSWFPGQIPFHWVRLGTLRLGNARVTPASSEVAFYATEPAAAAEFAPRLAEWSRTLPPGAIFEPGAPE